MPPLRKRAAPDPSDSDSSQTQNPRRQRPRQSNSAEMSDNDGNGEGTSAPSSLDAMVKKMVRMAMACEYARLPIRRTDISAKVLGEQGSRQFKTVFEQAQRELRGKFGMEMTELPAKEKTTLTQRRAAQRAEKPSSSNKSWVLTTTLPPKYRVPSILTPTKAPSTYLESTYTAIYTFIISVISLNGGTLPEQKLERYLGRVNADQQTPLEKTDKLIQRLCKDGYIVRTKEVDGGEEIIEFMVGPRGKIEVGSGGVAALAREVYGYGPGSDQTRGRNADGDDDSGEAETFNQMQREDRQQFEVRLKRTLGLPELRAATEQNYGDQAGDESRRSSRRAAAEKSEDESD
ncbi:uncharacterized protein N7483_001919 [Penicillium malachiteum]|uniref:uncharacterized protein n=1 Tax=Penicillium malachiteum TaxID=1324776 RepID=UPI002547AF0F|nr:uncharacterized protein N7483_001919 [Penicillium malachiteum]KAJ5736794.1 hypothetical protein N7483_001919 [Penicillium malachiteum]